MGKEKGGFLTPKQIANRIKAKGLQKLRWFCQMCQKQCRDENGFKCHTMSESHQRQLLLVADNPEKFVDEFSEDFCDDFLECLRLKCGTKRIQANNVYQDYIANRTHIHMNSTQWETLTEFVKWLGREGKCVVDETEKGWFIQLIDRKPETIERQKAMEKKAKMDQDSEERNRRLLERQIERAAKAETNQPQTEFTELQRENEEEKVVFKFGGAKPKDQVPSLSSAMSKNALSLNASSTAEDKHYSDTASSKSKGGAGKKRKSTALEEIIEMEEQLKVKKASRDYWLHKGIIVKLITKKLGDRYYNKKGVVKEVVDRYSAILEMLDSEEEINARQEQLQTVLPAIGKLVLILNGAYCGERATLESIDEKNFCCNIILRSGDRKSVV